MLKSIAESAPKKVPELFSSFISGKGKFREFKARERFKKSQKRFADLGKTEVVNARMQEGATFEQALTDAGFSSKERTTFIDDLEAAQRVFPGLEPRTLVKGIFSDDETLALPVDKAGAAAPRPTPSTPAGSIQAPGFDFQSGMPQMEQNVQPASIEQQALEQAISSGLPPTGEVIQRIAGTLREGRRRELVPEAQRILQNSGQEVTPERLDRLIQFLIRQSGEPQ